MEKKSINKRDLGSSIVMALVGLYVTFGKNVITGKTFGTESMPLAARADVYLRVLGGLLLVLSLVLMARALCRNEKTQKKEIPPVAVIGAILLIVFALIVKPLGFFVSASVLVAAWTFIFRVKEYHIDRNDKKALAKAAGISIAFALIIVAVLQLAFTHLLGVRLP